MQNKGSSNTEHATGQVATLPVETQTQPSTSAGTVDTLINRLHAAVKPAPEVDSDPETEAAFEAMVKKAPVKSAADLKQEQDDPFKPENLRLNQAALQSAVAKRLLITVPVKKPHRQDFIRVHPGEDYRLDVALMECERDIYCLAPSVCAELTESEYFTATLHVAINRQKVVFLWPVKLPGTDGRQMDWHISSADAAEAAKKKWVRMTANMDLGAYEVFEAVADYGEPEWPAQSMWELLKIAFKNRLIQSVDHQIIQKLRGLA